MGGIKHAMESGFEEFLNTHRENPSTRISLVQFDSENPFEQVYTAMPVGDAPKLNLQPRGMTPLRDALCLTIDAVGRRLAAMPEKSRPAKVLFIVITDGLENASYRFNTSDVRQRVTHQRDKYSWEFVFLGANQDAVIEAERLAFDPQKAITYTATLGSTRSAFKGLASNTLNYANAIGGTASAALDWSDQQRSETITDNG